MQHQKCFEAIDNLCSSAISRCTVSREHAQCLVRIHTNISHFAGNEWRYHSLTCCLPCFLDTHRSHRHSWMSNNVSCSLELSTEVIPKIPTHSQYQLGNLKSSSPILYRLASLRHLESVILSPNHRRLSCCVQPKNQGNIRHVLTGNFELSYVESILSAMLSNG